MSVSPHESQAQDQAGQPIGLALGYDPSLGVRAMSEQAAAAENAGFGTVFFSETLFTNRDSVSALTAFGLATNSVMLGATQVVRLRTPLLMAQTAATLDELTGGRLALTVGAFTAKHAARNGVELSDPVATLREYVECLRLLWTGDPVTYRGTVITMEDVALNWRPARADIPIWIAAASRKGLVNAARIGDGVLLDAGASPEYVANAVRLLNDTCAEIGRDPATLTIAQLINVSIEDDAARAIDAIRWEVASKFRYASTPRAKMSVGEPNYDPEELAMLARTYQEGGSAALVKAMPDRLVTALTATGTPERVRARVAEYRAAGVMLPLVRPAAPHQLSSLLRTFGGGSEGRE